MTDADYRLTLKKLGARVAYYRRLAEMTQEQLADAANVTWAAISKLERGVSGCRLRTLFDIAAALGVSPNELLE